MGSRQTPNNRWAWVLKIVRLLPVLRSLAVLMFDHRSHAGYTLAVTMTHSHVYARTKFASSGLDDVRAYVPRVLLAGPLAWDHGTNND